ncbi:MAG: hypothetical protein GXY05_02455 [Clostridiales bacterium]|nr:hypothetical protein [Clostridiales bacterium]
MEDSKPQEGTISGEASSLSAEADAGMRLRVSRDALLPVSVVGGLLGMLAGTLPAAVWVLIFGKSFAPAYVFLPLLIFLGIRIFKGCRDRRGFFLACILSVIGFYLTLLSCRAALDIIKYKMLFTSLPLVTAKLIGSSDAFAEPVFSPVYIFPALFTALGILLVYELMRHKPAPVTEANNPGLSS